MRVKLVSLMPVLSSLFYLTSLERWSLKKPIETMSLNMHIFFGGFPKILYFHQTSFFSEVKSWFSVVWGVSDTRQTIWDLTIFTFHFHIRAKQFPSSSFSKMYFVVIVLVKYPVFAVKSGLFAISDSKCF